MFGNVRRRDSSSFVLRAIKLKRGTWVNSRASISNLMLKI